MESKENNSDNKILLRLDVIFEHATEETHNNLLDVAFWKDYYFKNKEYTQLSFLDIENTTENEEAIQTYINNQIDKCRTTEALLNEVIYPYIKENKSLPYFLVMGDNPEETINRSNSIKEKIYNFAKLEDYTERELNNIFALRRDFYLIFNQTKTKRQKTYIKEKQKREEATESAIILREDQAPLIDVSNAPQIRNFIQILNLTKINEATAQKFADSINTIKGNKCVLTINDNQVMFVLHSKSGKIRDYMIGYTSYIDNPEEEKTRNASKNKLVKFFVYFMSKIKKINSYPEGEEKRLLTEEGKIKITYEELITAGIFDNLITAELELKYINDIILHLFMSVKMVNRGTLGHKFAILTEYKDSGSDKEFNPEEQGEAKGYKKEGRTIIYKLAEADLLLQILKFEMKLPNWIYSLNNNSFILAYNLFNYARINDLASFNYYYETIRNLLGLPEAKDTEHPKRDIKAPILKAIEEINQTAEKNKKGKQTDINIIAYDPEAKIKDFLTSGKAKIIIKNEDIIAFNNEIKLLKNGKNEENVKK